MNGVLGHDSRYALVRLYWAGTTWADEMNFVMNHTIRNKRIHSKNRML